MSGFDWANPSALYLLAVLPFMVWLAFRAERKRAAALCAFAEPETQPLVRRRLKTGLALAACGLAILAVARPTWEGRPAAVKGRDVLFVLDISRSMLADDLKPSRLEFARQALVNFAVSTRGDRLGLIAFAGSAALRCPLTPDYEFFRVAVEGSSPDTAALGGTEIAKAIRLAAKEGFDDLSHRSKHIVLITDAEDHGHAASATAAEAARLGIRVSAIGLGDEVTGSRIPVPDQGAVRFVTYRGQDVWSKLNAAAVRHIAEAGDGSALFFAGPTAEPQISRAVGGSPGRARKPRVEAFWIPLALAIAALASELAIPESRTE